MRAIQTVFVPRGPEEQAVRKGLAQAKACVQVVPMGIGPHAALLAAEEALGGATFGTALVTGLCGLLSPAFAVGDTLVYASIRRRGEAPLALERALGESVARRIAGAQSGVAALASEAIVTSRDQKFALRHESGAEAVDMESMALAERLQRAGVAVAVARIGSDALDDELPDLSSALDGSGGIDGFALFLAMLRKPVAGVRLARNGTRALGALQHALYALFR